MIRFPGVLFDWLRVACSKLVGHGLALVLLATCWAASAEELSDPYSRLPPRVTMLIVPLDDRPETRGDVELFQRLGTKAFGLPREKVVVAPVPGREAELLSLFAPLGDVSARLDHRDLLLVMFCGGTWKGGALKLKRGTTPLVKIVREANNLVYPQKAERDAWFRGTLALVFDSWVDVNDARLRESDLRNTILVAWETTAGRSPWDRRFVDGVVRQTPGLRRLPAFALADVFRSNEVYRPGAALATLSILTRLVDPLSKKSDLASVTEGMHNLTQAVSEIPSTDAGLASETRFGVRRGGGFDAEAFLVVLKDIRVFIDHVADGAVLSDASPVVDAAASLSAYLSLNAGQFFSGGQGVILLEPIEYALADLTCMLVPFEGKVNVQCLQANGLALVEADIAPSEFERAVPELAVQILKPFLSVHTEGIELMMAGKPRHVALVLDRSGSSVITDPTAVIDPGLGRRDSVRKMAFLRVVTELFHSSKAMADRNRLSVVFFAGGVEAFTFYGRDVKRDVPWEQAMAGFSAFYDAHVSPRPGTDIEKGLDAAFTAVRPDLDAFDTHVMLFTDGVDTSRDDSREAVARIEERIRTIQQARGSVHGIGMVPPRGFLERFRADAAVAGPMLAGYLRQILSAPEAAACWANDECRAWHARGAGGVARTDLSWLEQAIASSRNTTYEGVFASMTDADDLLAGLERVFAGFRGGELISVARSSAVDPTAGRDRFSFEVRDEGDYEFVISNRRELGALRFRATLDGRDVTRRLEIDVANPTQTVLRVKGAACGEWSITREGRTR